MATVPYLFFNGNCREAITFYEETFGGKADLIPYEQSPDPGNLPENIDRKAIMHARLVLPDGSTIMASDDMSGDPYRGMHGYAISVTFKTADEVRHAFERLSEGGHVWMPLTKTFWSELFGMCADRFGTSWMIGVEGQQ